jgi:hypothetical protein
METNSVCTHVYNSHREGRGERSNRSLHAVEMWKTTINLWKTNILIQFRGIVVECKIFLI